MLNRSLVGIKWLIQLISSPHNVHFLLTPVGWSVFCWLIGFQKWQLIGLKGWKMFLLMTLLPFRINWLFGISGCCFLLNSQWGVTGEVGGWGWSFALRQKIASEQFSQKPSSYSTTELYHAVTLLCLLKSSLRVKSSQVKVSCGQNSQWSDPFQRLNSALIFCLLPKLPSVSAALHLQCVWCTSPQQNIHWGFTI